MEYNNPTLDLDAIKNADTTLLDEYSWAVLTKGESNTDPYYKFPFVEGYYARTALDSGGLPFDSVVLVSNSKDGIVLVSKKRLEKAVEDAITLYHDKLVEKFAVFEYGRKTDKNKDYGIEKVVVPPRSLDSSKTGKHPVGLPSDVEHWSYDLTRAVMDTLGVSMQTSNHPYYAEFFNEIDEIIWSKLKVDIETMLKRGVINDDNIAQMVADNFDTIPSTANKYNLPVQTVKIFDGLDKEQKERMVFLLEEAENVVLGYDSKIVSAILSHIKNSSELPLMLIPDLLSITREIKASEKNGFDIEEPLSEMDTDSYCAYNNFSVAKLIEDSCLSVISDLNKGAQPNTTKGNGIETKEELIKNLKKAIAGGTLDAFLKEHVVAIDRNDMGEPTYLLIASESNNEQTIEYEVWSGCIWYTRENQLNGEPQDASAYLYDDPIRETVTNIISKLYSTPKNENILTYEKWNPFAENIQENELSKKPNLYFTQNDECIEARMTTSGEDEVVAYIKGLKGVEYLQEGLPETIVEQIEDRNDKETIIQVLDRNVKRRAENKAMHQNKVNNL